MRLAVAHEWLTNWAGSERVAEQLVRTAAPAELVAAVVDPALAQEHFGDLPVRSLWPGRLPGATTHWTRYAPAMLAAWAGTRVRADALLVSAHFAAHAATVRFDGPSIVYYHSPARILWRSDLELARLPVRARALAAATVLPPLRRYDRWVGGHPTVALANSTAVARRLADAYGRPAQVIHPPVAVERWSGVVRRREPSRLVWFGRLVPYKRPDLAIEAARRAGLPLTMIGDGPERARLEASAPDGVRFLGHAPVEVVRDALADARVLVFPGEEDFGIAAVEALAAGVPVVAPALGGAPDFLRHGENGLLTRTQDPDELAAALRTAWDTSWDHAAIRAGAQRFAPERFRAELAEVLDLTLGSGWRPRLRPLPAL